MQLKVLKQKEKSHDAAINNFKELRDETVNDKVK